MCSRQLAKQHGHELPPTRESSGVVFPFTLLDEAFELCPWKQLQKLTENAAYSIQGGASWLFARSAELQSTYQRRRPTKTLIWTRVAGRPVPHAHQILIWQCGTGLPACLLLPLSF